MMPFMTRHVPACAQLDTRRQEAPQLSPRRPAEAACVYADAHASYCMNKGHGTGIEDVLGREVLSF